MAPTVGLIHQAVRKWRRPFLDGGLKGLEDAPQWACPSVNGPTDRLVLMAKLTEEHPQFSSRGVTPSSMRP